MEEALVETSRLQHIIDGLLSLSRAESRSIDLTDAHLSGIARSRQEQSRGSSESEGSGLGSAIVRQVPEAFVQFTGTVRK